MIKRFHTVIHVHVHYKYLRFSFYCTAFLTFDLLFLSVSYICIDEGEAG